MPTEFQQQNIEERMYELALDALEAGMRAPEFMVVAVNALRQAAERTKDRVEDYLDRIRGQL